MAVAPRWAVMHAETIAHHVCSHFHFGQLTRMHDVLERGKKDYANDCSSTSLNIKSPPSSILTTKASISSSWTMWIPTWLDSVPFFQNTIFIERLKNELSYKGLYNIQLTQSTLRTSQRFLKGKITPAVLQTSHLLAAMLVPLDKPGLAKVLAQELASLCTAQNDIALPA